MPQFKSTENLIGKSFDRSLETPVMQNTMIEKENNHRFCNDLEDQKGFYFYRYL